MRRFSDKGLGRSYSDNPDSSFRSQRLPGGSREKAYLDPSRVLVTSINACLLNAMLAGLYRSSCRCLGTNTTNSPARLHYKYCSVHALALLRFTSIQLPRRLPFASTGASYNVMAPKQATLGYVKPSQQTIGCVGGVDAACYMRPWYT